MKIRRKILCGLALAAVLAGCETRKAELVLPSEDSHEALGGEETAFVVEVDSLLTERYHLEYDSPDYYRLDITIPFLRSDLPGAEEINGQIAEDFALFLDKAPEEFASVEWGFYYPMVQIHSEQYIFGDLLELVIRYEAYSLYGSGPAAFNRVYCYDLREQTVSSLSHLMEQLDVSEEDVIGKYMEHYGVGEEERDLITFESDLLGFFFLDEDGTIQIEANW